MTRVPLESPLVWVAFATAAWEAGKEVLGSARKRAGRASGEAAAEAAASGSSASPLSRTASATLAPVTPRVPQGQPGAACATELQSSACNRGAHQLRAGKVSTPLASYPTMPAVPPCRGGAAQATC